MSFDDYLDRPVTDRYLMNVALGDLIEQSNEQGGGRPKDDR